MFFKINKIKYQESNMQNFNMSIIEGNLVKDPEFLEVGEKRTKLCKFRIGSNRVVRKQNGETEQYSNFFDVTTWSKLADVCGKYLKKGSRVLVSGLLKQDQWKSEDGSNRFKVYIEGREVNFLSPKSA